MTCWSRTNANECCITGGTAVFSQIQRDGRPGWERHQRSTGRPLWVFMHFYIACCWSCNLHSLLLPEMYWCEEMSTKKKRSCLTLQSVGSGHPRPVCGTVHPNSSGEQKKDQAHRQRHQSSMERDLLLHLRPQPTECLGGWTCLSAPIAMINIKSSGTMTHC